MVTQAYPRDYFRNNTGNYTTQPQDAAPAPPAHPLDPNIVYLTLAIIALFGLIAVLAYFRGKKE